MNKPVLAVDIDEVLAHFIPILAEFHNLHYNKEGQGTHMSAASFSSFEFHKVWGGSPSEASVKMENFYESVHFKEIPPIADALQACLSLKMNFDLQIITARQTKLREVTVDWVEKHYPGIFSHYHFGNHWSTEGVSRSKPQVGRCVHVY